MRYIGQGYEIEVSINNKCLDINDIKNIRIEFERVYKDLLEEVKMPQEVISLRTIATSMCVKPSLNKIGLIYQYSRKSKNEKFILVERRILTLCFRK